MSLQIPSTLIESFDPDNDQNLGPRWDKWTKRLDQFFIASGLKVGDSASKMEAILFLFGGVRLAEIHGILTADAPTGTATDVYSQACGKLKAHFEPKRNHMMEQFNFGRTKQRTTETVENYVTRLRILAKYCEFADSDKAILTHVVLNFHSSRLRRELLKVTDLKIARLLELGRIHDTVNDQVDQVEGKHIKEEDEEGEKIEAK